MEITRRGAETQPGPAEWLTGSAWLDEIAVPPLPSRLRAHAVHFAPGARTIWHRHPLGQVLHVTAGAGLVQREGGAVEAIRTGDTVWIEPGEWHWHGAGPTSFMTHLAIQEAAADGVEAERGAPVSDADYLASV